MKEEEFEQYALQYLNGELTDNEKLDFESLLSGDASKKQYLNELKTIRVLAKEEGFERADDSLKEVFYAMLNKHRSEHTNSDNNWMKQIESFIVWLTQFKKVGQFVAASFIALLSGFIGYQLNTNNSGELSVLSNDLEMMKLEVASLQLKSYSPTDRIQGVNYLESSKLNEEIIVGSLIDKLLHDDNMHVRITAGRSLANFSQRIEVIMALIDAVRSEEELLVKITLIDVLMNIDQKTAMDEVNEILNQEGISRQMQDALNQIVKTKSI